jgi:hypothetical protein
MTPEGYQAVVEAMEAEVRHSRYEIFPQPLEGEDVECVTISRAFPTQQIMAGLVLTALGRANLLDSSENDEGLPKLALFDIQFGSVTFMDLGSKGIYVTPEPETT